MKLFHYSLKFLIFGSLISFLLVPCFSIAMMPGTQESVESKEYRFLCAAAEGDHEVIRCLLKAQVDPDTPHIDNYGWPALCRLAAAGNLEGVRLLVEAGAQIDSKTFPEGPAWGLHYLPPYGYTALHLAANEGRLKVVEFLLEQKNIDINARTRNGEGSTALELANRWNQHDVASLLLKKGARH